MCVDLVTCNFAEFFISSSNFLLDSLGFSIYRIISLLSRDKYNLSFPIWKSFISFSYLIALARISSTILNSSGESGHPCLVLDLSEKAFSLLPSV